MVYAWLIVAFALFMAAIWSVHAMNRLAQARDGYQPFSLPNAALMLVANLLLLSAVSSQGDGGRGLAGLFSGVEPVVSIKLAAAGVLSTFVFLVIARRTRLWIALYAVALMAVGAIAILPSLIFAQMAAGGDKQ